MSFQNSISSQTLTTTSSPTFNNLYNAYSSTPTSGSTTTLTASSTSLQYFTGTLDQTLVMPVTSTLSLNMTYKIINNSSGNITINSSDGNLIKIIVAGGQTSLTCILTNDNTASAWNLLYSPLSSLSDPNINITGSFVSKNYSTSMSTNFFINGTPIQTGNSIRTFGTIYTSPQDSLITIDYGTANYIIETLGFSSTSLTSISGNNVIATDGAFNGTWNSLATFSFPLLKYGFAVLSFTSSSITTLSFPSLTQAGNIQVNCSSCTTFSMPNLQYLVYFGPTVSATTISMPLLSVVKGNFAPTINSCTTLTLTALSSVGAGLSGGFIPTANALTSLSLPSLTIVGSDFTITAPNMTTFSINSGLLQIEGNFAISGAKLNQASVDGILVRLAALDGTGGTTTYSSKTVTLNGGTSSAPSATGLAAKATLVSRSCVVITN